MKRKRKRTETAIKTEVESEKELKKTVKNLLTKDKGKCKRELIGLGIELKRG
jgi:hypothetical protein